MLSIQVQCTTPLLGRYVAIHFLTLSQFTYLVLQGVEVYAVPGECKLAFQCAMVDIKDVRVSRI